MKKDKGESFGKRSKKLLALIAALAGMGISAASVFAATELYDSFFRRFERPDYAVTAGLCNYELVRDALPREEVTFLSRRVKLKGYVYRCENSKGTVVLCHGMHAGADDYLPVALFFHGRGYSVFAFDCCGTYSSEGNSTVGMCQSLVDLDSALKYAKSNFDGPLLLFGHSWGGYAAASVLALHKEIRACACVSAFNNGYTLIADKGRQYAGELAVNGLPNVFLEQYQKALFGKYVNYNGVDGINSTDIPVLVAHGKEDKVISFDGQSIIAHRQEITNPNATYYVGVGSVGGHTDILYSQAANSYRKQVSESLKALERDCVSYEEKAAFYGTVNHFLYSQLNAELFDAIADMFDGAVS